VTVLSVDGLAKRWDASSGLPPVSFELDPGELLAVRGRSGTGKSTLLSILAGWCPQDAGTVVRHGEWGEGDAWRRWEHTAVVPQVMALQPELSVLENVTLAARTRVRREAEQAAMQLFEELDVAALADRSPGETSMGQQQRITIARALIAAPTLLLIDEPTSHQDDGHAALVIEAVRRCTKGGTAAIVVTHDHRADAHTERVLTLSPIDET